MEVDTQTMARTRLLGKRVEDVLRSLERKASKRVRDDMRTRYGITAAKAFGVPMAAMQQIGRALGRDQALAAALWETGWYEARMVACFVADPALVTAAQMDRWVRGMDNWGICDTACFFLFDRTPHAWRKVEQWSRRREEFVKRTAFALIACLALHDKQAADERFLRLLPLIARGATDDRNFVKKGVSWALRAVGRRNPVLNAAASDTAERLTRSDNPAARWIGNDALRDLRKKRSPAVARRTSMRVTNATRR
ncbi:MAG TPA: DNA alkylation repair protein [Vicinamibacterales bacterium]|nr:DNA alkylation repair protein [Vicinamibacterales bacterium]